MLDSDSDYGWAMDDRRSYPMSGRPGGGQAEQALAVFAGHGLAFERGRPAHSPAPSARISWSRVRARDEVPRRSTQAGTGHEGDRRPRQVQGEPLGPRGRPGDRPGRRRRRARRRRSTSSRWPTAARGRSRPSSRRPAARYPRGDRHRAARRAGRRPFRAARRRPDGGRSRWRRPRAWSWSRTIAATRCGPRPSGPASCSSPRSTTGPSRLIVGIGGSATNDGGAGLAQALGLPAARRRRATNSRPGAARSAGSTGSTPPDVDPRLAGVSVAVACDVDNPLCGPRGASAVYGPQKGATPAMVDELDRNLGRLRPDHRARPRASTSPTCPAPGAAGGLGAGLVAFAGGRLEPGVALVIEAVGPGRSAPGRRPLPDRRGVARRLQRLRQDGRRRRPAGPVARRARRSPWPGRSGRAPRTCSLEGIDAYFSLCPGPDLARRGDRPRPPDLLERTPPSRPSGPSWPAVGASTEPWMPARPIGEFGLIAWIRERSTRRRSGRARDRRRLRGAPVHAGRRGPGHDRHADGRPPLPARRGDAPSEVGYKALAVNLSDIAAMAGVPVAAFVAVALPRGRRSRSAQGLHAGMAPLAERFGVTLAGGDTNAWDGPLVVTVTLLGETTAAGRRPALGRQAGRRDPRDRPARREPARSPSPARCPGSPRPWRSPRPRRSTR